MWETCIFSHAVGVTQRFHSIKGRGGGGDHEISRGRAKGFGPLIFPFYLQIVNLRLFSNK